MRALLLSLGPALALGACVKEGVLNKDPLLVAPSMCLGEGPGPFIGFACVSNSSEVCGHLDGLPEELLDEPSMQQLLLQGEELLALSGHRLLDGGR